MISQTLTRESAIILLVSWVVLSDVDIEMEFGVLKEAFYPTSDTGRGTPRRQAHPEGTESRTQSDDHMLFLLPGAQGLALP